MSDMVLECISLMNYAWRRHPRLLRCYRTVCIVCSIATQRMVHLPLCAEYAGATLGAHADATRLLYMKTLFDLCVFFVLYDVFLLWKIIRQM
jgi:hypothetical protein